MSLQRIVVSIIATFGFVLNSLVVASILKQWRKVKLRHLLLTSLALSDIGATLTALPLELVGNRGICKVSAYLVSTFALVSISHIVSLSVERVITMKFPLQCTVMFASKRSSLMFIVPSWLYGLMWGTFPWFGWGGYAVESVSRHRCSIDLKTPTMAVQSYNYSLLVFCYIVPILAFLVCFVIIKKEMKRMLQFAQSLTGKDSNSAKASARSERLFTFVVLVMLIAFLLAWTPYAMCVFYITVHGGISTNVLDAAAYLGKSSSVFNPIIYAFMYKEFRGAVRRLFNIRTNKVATANRITGWSLWGNTNKSKNVTETNRDISLNAPSQNNNRDITASFNQDNGEVPDISL